MPTVASIINDLLLLFNFFIKLAMQTQIIASYVAKVKCTLVRYSVILAIAIMSQCMRNMHGLVHNQPPLL